MKALLAFVDDLWRSFFRQVSVVPLIMNGLMNRPTGHRPRGPKGQGPKSLFEMTVTISRWKITKLCPDRPQRQKEMQNNYKDTWNNHKVTTTTTRRCKITAKKMHRDYRDINDHKDTTKGCKMTPESQDDYKDTKTKRHSMNPEDHKMTAVFVLSLGVLLLCWRVRGLLHVYAQGTIVS